MGIIETRPTLTDLMNRIEANHVGNPWEPQPPNWKRIQVVVVKELTALKPTLCTATLTAYSSSGDVKVLCLRKIPEGGDLCDWHRGD